jgi:hypothetical protein
MKNRLYVLGQKLDPFYETVVVIFDEDGHIKELKQSTYQSHTLKIVQTQTGLWPYTKVPSIKGIWDTNLI